MRSIASLYTSVLLPASFNCNNLILHQQKLKMDSSNMHDASDKRGKPWEDHEVVALCSFVGSHASRLFGSGGRGSLGVERQKTDAWEECRRHIVAAGGRPDRSWAKLRKKWQDLASKAKKYSTQRKQQVHGTGGGGFVPAHRLYELVLQALPDELRDGIAPIDMAETAPSSGSHKNGVEVVKRHAEVSVVPATVTSSQTSQENVRKQHAALSIERVPATVTSLQGAIQTVRKRPATRMDTETEDSQESQQEGKRKRKKGKKAAKKETDEVNLLSLNKTMAANEHRKVEVLEGILTTLQGIHGCLQILTATPQSTAADIQTHAEQ
eukprot:XP_011681239.1 PREDICTED: uncharacterized protein LOC105446320 [Strongylocentrotus purpuratus]